MLRPTTPEERLAEVKERLRFSYTVGYFGTVAAAEFLKLQNGESLEFTAFILLVGCTVFAAFVTRALWLFLVPWLGRMSFGSAVDALATPNAHPRFVTTFLESWWRNEMALDVFLVVFQIVLGLACFRFFGPKLGLL